MATTDENSENPTDETANVFNSRAGNRRDSLIPERAEATFSYTTATYEEYLTMDALGRNAGTSPKSFSKRVAADETNDTIDINGATDATGADDAATQNADATATNNDGNDEAGPDATASTGAHHPLRTALQAIRRWCGSVASGWARLCDAPAARAIHTVWSHRLRFSFAFYAIIFAIATFGAVILLQWSVYTTPTYADPDAVDNTTKILESMRGQLTRFVSQMWLEHRMNFLLNFMVLGLFYLILVFVINRFWVATALFSSIMIVFAVANDIKVGLRNEPIIPSDLTFVSGGNSGQLLSFIPEESQALVHNAIVALIWIVAVCIVLQFVDRRNCVIPFHWRRPLRDVKTVVGNCSRILAVAVSTAVLVSFTWNLGIPGSWSYQFATRLGDVPILYNAMADSSNNGPAMNFLRLAHAKTMEKPEDYSKSTMEELAERYTDNADAINQTRTNELTDSTVIMILSETFSDPTRVPGIVLGEDPMPNIRAVKNTTTSGLMLSPSIGGGTANIEYQSLTGLNLALFDDSMQSPYQELVPHQKHPYTFNQIWNERYGEDGSVAYHPYYKNMYLRDTDYKKFGFSHLYTLDSDPAITHQDRIDNSPNVSDAAAYQNVLDALNDEGTDHPQFIQLVTMQNHLPYNDWYANNQFKDLDYSELSDNEKWSIDTYIKGINITDQATADFLNQLNALDKPVTVIFYGDHLPGIYTTAASDENNALALHETDYFIWSNQASASADTKLDVRDSGFTSSNYFMSMAAEHMNAKVSAYLELLDEVHEEIPAFSRMVASNADWGEGDATYLDANGTPITYKNLSKRAKQLLKDYKLVQYDLTAGKGYLNDTEFFAVK